MRAARCRCLPALAAALMSRHGRMGMLKRLICAAAATLALLSATAIAGAADYPERPVTIVVGFPPGGASDILARIMADIPGNVLGKPFVVNNRPGAGGNVAGEVVAHAAADGYKLLLGNKASLATKDSVH